MTRSKYPWLATWLVGYEYFTLVLGGCYGQFLCDRLIQDISGKSDEKMIFCPDPTDRQM